MTDFSGFGLPSALSGNLARMGYTTPTPIQVQALPPALLGKDVLGSAQTGTGKTAAFGIPLAVKLLSNPRGSALVLTPTRELAAQVMTVLKDILEGSGIKTALLIGGESMGGQFAQLKARPRLIIGTPGRINDHLERGTLMLNDTSFLVLDETDRMLDMGFSQQLDKIFRFLPRVRQTLMFSATFPPNIVSISQKYLTDPVRIQAGEESKPATNIAHSVIHTESANKYTTLLKELTNREGSIIVFVKTKHGAERLAIRLSKERFSADAIHGNLKQNKRDRVISDFRNQKHRIMVATDIAARGLDIPHIAHVINYDLPQAAEDYIHRIGRTARAGAQGEAISLIAPEDAGKWREIERLMNPHSKTPQPPHGGGSFKSGNKRRSHWRSQRNASSGHAGNTRRIAG